MHLHISVEASLSSAGNWVQVMGHRETTELDYSVESNCEDHLSVSRGLGDKQGEEKDG